MRFSVAAAHRMYIGPPDRTLEEVSEHYGVCVKTLRERFRSARLPLATRPQRMQTRRRLDDLPEEIDPAVRELLEIVIRRKIPWPTFEDHVRIWLYRPPVGPGPPIATFRRALQQIGLDLAIVPRAYDEQDVPPATLRLVSSGATAA